MSVMRVNILKPVLLPARCTMSIIPFYENGYWMSKSVNRSSGISVEETKMVYSMNMSVFLPVIFITLKQFKQCVFGYPWKIQGHPEQNG